MHPRDIVALLIFVGIGAFNQWMKKRKAEQAKNSRLPPARPQPRPPRTEAPAPPPVMERPRPSAAEPDDEEDDWENDAFEPTPQRESGARPAARPADPVEQAKAAGKDLLSQLAKELGLELPGATRPPPRPGNVHVTHRPAPHPAPKPRPEPEADERPAPSMAAPVPPMSGNRAAAAEPAVAFSDFSDPAALRRAVILKTILDKPLSLRPRLPGD
jgi:hypothetical protein